MNRKVKSVLRPYWSIFKDTIRTVKGLVIKPIQSLPISSEVIGPPKGFYESTRKWLAINNFTQNNSQGSYQEIYPLHVVHRAKPGTLDKDVHWKFNLEYEREILPSFVTVIPQGRVWVNKGKIVDYTAVITADDRLLSELSIEFGRLPNNHSIFTEWKLPPVHIIEGTAAVLTSAKANIYFHWMTDLLPRIELLRRSGIALDGIDTFIVNSYNSPFQKETLTTLGIPPSKIVESSKNQHIKADKLIAPSLPSLPGNPPLWVCDFLREEFLNTSLAATVLPSVNKLEHIYISRANASYRRVLNEADVADFLNKLGFHCVVLESLTVAEQAALFHSAKVIVAPHGAGLTNTVFCQPGTKIIEFFSPKYVNVCYWSLANQVNLDYYYLLGEGQNPPEGVDPHLSGDDIFVNVDSLSKILKVAGIA
jgi:capsular polysaccharide biosynthesis protein